jgi:hypothetical protein
MGIHVCHVGKIRLVQVAVFDEDLRKPPAMETENAEGRPGLNRHRK